MATAKAVARVERLIWVLIYVGLFGIVIGMAALGRANATAWSLIVIGSVLTVVGAVLIWVRSRMDDEPQRAQQGKQP